MTQQTVMEQNLQSLLSPDNKVRNQAESYFDNADKQHLAVQLLQYVSNPQFTQICCALLRKMVDDLSDATAQQVFEQSKNFQDLKPVQFLIATIVKKYDFGFDGLTHASLAKCLEYAPKKFTLDQLMHIVHEKPDLDTFKGFCQYLIAVKPEPASVSELISSFINIMTEEYFEPMAEVADYTAAYLSPSYELYLSKCLQYIQLNSQLALECAVLYIEQKPESLVNHPIINRIIEQLLQWVCDVNLTDEEFAAFEEDDAQSNYIVAEMALDRLSRALVDALLPMVMNSLNSMLNDSKWNVRYGAFMCLSSIAEGCISSLTEEMDELVALITKYFTDPNPRVRFAAAHCIGQLATDLAPDLSEIYHSSIMNGLLHLMSDKVPRVAAHAANASMNILENLPKDESSLYIEPLMTQYAQLFGSNNRQIQQICISAVATLADAAEDKFIPYMPTIVPQFMSILTELVGELDMSHQELRAKLVECLTLIALAVKRPAFDPYLDQLITILRKFNVVKLDDSSLDPLPSYLLSAWARMCRVLKSDFAPLLPECMPLVLAYASHNPAIEIIEPDEVANFSKEDGWFVANVESNRVAVNTSQIEEMSTAVEMISIYAETLKNEFMPFSNDCIDLVVPLIKFLFSDEVRLASIRCIPKLVDCLNPQLQEAAIVYVIKEYISTLENEIDFELTSYIIGGLSSFILKFGYCLDEEDTALLFDTSVELLKQLNEQLANREEELSYAYDEDIVNEDNTLFELASLFQTCFKVHADYFVNIYHLKIYPVVYSFLGHVNSEAKQFACLCIDDIIEFGPMTYKLSVILNVGETFASMLTTPTESIKQAVSYGIGVLAQVDPMNSRQYCEQCIPLLINNINMDSERNVTSYGATDNAIAALIKIMKYAHIQTPEMVNAVFKGLPLLADEEEFQQVYDYIFTSCIQHFNACPYNKQVAILIEPIFKGLTKQQFPSQFKQLYSQVFSMCLQNNEFKMNLEQLLSTVSANSQRQVHDFFK